MTKCTGCGSGLTEGTTDHRLKIAGHEFHSKVPALVCISCGESYIEGPVLERFDLAVAAALLPSGETYGSVLKFARKALGLRATDLAELLGVAPESVSRWENDARSPDHAVLVLLSLLVSEAQLGVTSVRDQLEALQTKIPLNRVVVINLNDT